MSAIKKVIEAGLDDYWSEQFLETVNEALAELAALEAVAEAADRALLPAKLDHAICFTFFSDENEECEFVILASAIEKWKALR